MRIVFMGTPDFAAASLERLLADGFEVAAVYTQPDKARDRGHHVSFSPVKELALKNRLSVYQPETLKSEEETERIFALAPDLIVTVAYGKLLPSSFLEAGRLGAVNLHGSLLPRYRGAAPVQWAVINGDRTTGVTTFYLNERMDAGDMIYSEETEIGEYETSGQLFERLKVMGAALLSRTLRDIERGCAPRIPQREEEASYVGKLDRSLSPIDWSLSSRMIISRVYGLQPWPVATAELFGETCKIFSVKATEHQTTQPSGTLLSTGKEGIEMACGDGKSLLITELQRPGKRRMTAEEFLRGLRLAP